MTQANILDQEITKIIASERRATAELILKLRKLDSTRGYIELGFTSLFDYLTRGKKYSNGSAQRRIDAVRLSKDVPEVARKFETGALDFHHVATMSKAIRQVKKHRKVSALEKSEMLEKIACKSEAATQQMVAEFFDLDVVYETKKTVQKDESVRIELSLSKELAAKIEQAQALISHAVPTKDLVAYLEYTADKIIKQKTEKPREYKKKESREQSTTTMVVKSTAQEHHTQISTRTHRTLRSEQRACVQCGSGWFPQTDHKRSRWLGGTNEHANLQTLCGPCNRAKFQREWQELRAITI